MKRLCVLIPTFVVFFLISTYNYFSQLLPPPESVVTVATFLDRHGEPFATLAYPKRQNWVPLEEISPLFVEAILATEDQHFYEHSGFDPVRIAHSLWINLKGDSGLVGASTISQQYSRNLFNNFDKTWSRKIREALYTIRLEASYDKNQILEGYLNTINFGHGNCGITDASAFYFDKLPSELTLSEATLLAGIPNSPTYYSPLRYPEAAEKRQQTVLTVMKSNGEMPTIIGQKKSKPYDYYLDGVFNELDHLSLKHRPKITVKTTYDPEIQHHVTSAIKANVHDEALQTSIVVMEPHTGAILALNGGQNSEYNRALQSRRQIGSLIKPLLYYSALEYGFNPSTTFSSRPTNFLYSDGQEIYDPQNNKNQYPDTPISLAHALATSDNIFAVKTHMFLGMDILPYTASRLGLLNVEEIPSAALGVNDASTLEMAQAYGVFANEGRALNQHFITEVSTPKRALYKVSTKKQPQLLDPSKTFILNEMMTGMFNPLHNNHLNATGHYLAPHLSRRYGGKTGTTQTDSWIVGYAPELLTAVWTGYDDNQYLENTTISHLIWADIMENALGESQSWYEPVKDVVAVKVEAYTGKPASDGIELYYEKDNLPGN